MKEAKPNGKNTSPSVEPNATPYQPDTATQKAKAQKLHPIAADLEEYKAALGDGTLQYRGLVSGFNEIDELLSGLDRFVLLAGRSGAGKTTLATQLALGVADHTPVLFYSLEMAAADIMTTMLQVYARGLYRNDIELRGNAADLQKDIKEKLNKAFDQLGKVAGNIYLRDGSLGIPKIADTSDQNSIINMVEALKLKHKTERVLVVIDSVQDLVMLHPNQVQAEVKTVQDLTELQQKTGATVFVLAQKNKGSVNSGDSYGDVMGSMSFIHKPTTVIELITAKELLDKKAKQKGATGKVSAQDAQEAKQLEADIEADAKGGGAKPMYLSVIKGRYTGQSAVPLQYYGAHGYYTGGQVKRYADVYQPFKD